MSGIKLGDHRVVLAKSVEKAEEWDAYGNPVKGTVYRVLRWCLFTPARSSEGNDRSAPAIVGATLLAPPQDATDIAGADQIIYPYTEQPDGTYTGTAWEILGEVGRWDEAAECLLRRLA